MEFTPRYHRNPSLPFPHIRASVPVFDTKAKTVEVITLANGELKESVIAFPLPHVGDTPVSAEEARVIAPHIVERARTVIGRIDRRLVAATLERNRRLRRNGFA